MAPTSKLLYFAIGLLMVDSIIELSFVSSTVAWLHRRAGGSFQIAYKGSQYSLHGKPAHEYADQGHTSNGAAGTAFVLIGMGGILVLFLRSRPNLWRQGWTKVLYHVWLVLTVLSAALTLSALIYTFVVTAKYGGQVIDQTVASQLNNHPYPNYVKYPLDTWTPENWFDAVLQLDLVNASDRNAIQTKTAVMRGWRINLIPMFIIGSIVAVLAFLDAFQRRRETRDARLMENISHDKGSPNPNL